MRKRTDFHRSRYTARVPNLCCWTQGEYPRAAMDVLWNGEGMLSSCSSLKPIQTTFNTTAHASTSIISTLDAGDKHEFDKFVGINNEKLLLSDRENTGTARYIRSNIDSGLESTLVSLATC